MAQIVLSAAATAASSGANVLVQTAAAAAASFVGGQIDQLLFGPRRGRPIEGPRLDDLQVQASTEGAPILRIIGRARVAGQIIWATNFKETIVESTQSSGGKGGAPRGQSDVTEYKYAANFAVGLCEGEIDRIGRVWADGKPAALADYVVRVYKGTETQQADSLIEAVEGAGQAPAFRGLAYVVFEELPLERFGNRLPQFTFEVFRSLRGNDPEALENRLEAVNIIPGSGEFVYATEPVRRELGEGVTEVENVNNNMGVADFVASMDLLEDLAPSLDAAALVVSWFGDDLRCGQTDLRPGVETATKTSSPQTWSAGGADRAGARLVSQIDGRPAYGGTPSDASVKQAIADLKSRGKTVVFYPFLLMDVPAGNALGDPYTGETGQAAYPWRGRVTCDPAPGVAGTVDKTAAATTQVDAFFGTAAMGDFAQTDGEVVYTGPNEWSYRRMILHYANLCAIAGGVEAFLIGSEMRGLTTVRGAGNSFPAVSQLQALAADVKAILGAGTKVSYAADWSEYANYRPADGSNDVYFHLDPLWADVNVDFIGIDNYMPLSDWRDGLAHLDALAGYQSIYDIGYLQSNIRGGEGYDWFYADGAARDAQTRITIADTAEGKDWVFRIKDLWGWWTNAHYDRPGGVESSTATAWAAQSKPFWFTELGAPAVDKGANQPNVFIDPKSSETGLPYYSNGQRDDFIQRRFLEAHLSYWNGGAANNPISSVYGAEMVTTDRVFAYAWDARAYPDFPDRHDVWGDTENWSLGHWLTGRIGRVPLNVAITSLARESGFSEIVTDRVEGLITGYVVDRPMSPRAALEPLLDVFQIDAVESGSEIRFVARGGEAVSTVSEGDLAAEEPGSFELRRAQETDLPVEVQLGHFDSEAEYRHSIAESRLLTTPSQRLATIEFAAMLEAGDAQALADSLLAESWVMRDTQTFRLPPSRLALEPSDVLTLNVAGQSIEARLLSLEDRADRAVRGVRNEKSVYRRPAGATRRLARATLPTYGAPVLELLDLPLLRGDEIPHAPWAAAFSNPWPGGVALYRSRTGGEATLSLVLSAPAVMGRLSAELAPGPVGRWDRTNVLSVLVNGGALQSRTRLDVLGGANAVAIEAPNGEWEIVQFETAQLTGAGQYSLVGLLRGQAGTEGLVTLTKPVDARFVLLDDTVRQVPFSVDDRGLDFEWRFGPQGAALGDPTFGSLNKAFDGIGLRPYSPAHIRVAREGANLRFSWVRRTRVGGDSWESPDVPLGEETERYEVDVFNGGNVVRTLKTVTPSALYELADQEADFGAGGPTGTLNLSVHQLSAAFGRGAGRSVSLTL